MKKMFATFGRMIPMIVVMGIIFYLSHQTGDSLYVPPIPGFDKIAHFIIYAILAATVLYLFYPGLENGNRSFLSVCMITVVICTFYGLTDEFHQSFIPGRMVSFADVVADVFGAVIACAVYFLYKQRTNYLEKRTV